MTTMLIWVGVAVIGGFGAIARFVIDRAVTKHKSSSFPLGTFVINISGAWLLGFVGGLVLRPDIALLAGTAFVGAYTTFSTWMLETHRLGEERQLSFAFANIAVSVLLGLGAAALGLWMGGLCVQH